jgi:hypothetical protein
MPTIGELLDALKFQRMVGGDSGSCFGVTDPSRLRPEFQKEEEKPLILCEGCRGEGEHECRRKLKVKHGGRRLKSRCGFSFPCECPSCNK